MTYKALAEDAKKRLDKYLVERLPQYSRSQIKKFIEQELVLVNKKKATVHQFLKIDDIIAFTPPAKIEKDPIPALEILAKGNGYVVINKPAGLLAHSAQAAMHEATVADWLIEHYPEAKIVGDVDRPGIVHRLDRDTSGTMVLATSSEMYNLLKLQFHDRLIKKTYLALVHDHLTEPKGIIDKPIGRSKKDGRMAARVEKLSEADRDAITEYEVEKSYEQYDLVKARPLTGRTHQIRVHLMSLANPIVGDKIYTIHGQKNIVDMGRIFLHAMELEFTDLEGNQVVVQSPLPKELETFLSTIK